MSALRCLADNSVDLVAGLSIVLGIGTLAVTLCRSPHHRHRLAELTLGAALVAFVLLLLPLPRPFAGGRIASVPDVPRSQPARSGVASPVRQELVANGAVALPSDSLSRGARDARSARSLAADPPRTAARHAPASLPTATAFARAFLAGAILFGLHLALSLALLWGALRRAQPAAAWIDALLEGSERPRVLVEARTTRPFCCGLGRGTIVLPASLARSALAGCVEAVLRHEEAHLAQKHPRGRLIAALAAPLLYWHPLYWRLARGLRHDAELVADDMAAGRLDKRRYVEEMLALARQAQPTLLPHAVRVGVLGSHKSFLERMETLLMRPSRLQTVTSSAHTSARSLGALLLLGAVSVAWGQPPQDTNDGPRMLGGSLQGPGSDRGPSEPPVTTTDPFSIATVDLTDGTLEAVLFVRGSREVGDFVVGCAAADVPIRAIEIADANAKPLELRVVLGTSDLDVVELLAHLTDGVSQYRVSARGSVHSDGLPASLETPSSSHDLQDEVAELRARVDQLASLCERLLAEKAGSAPTVDPMKVPASTPSIRGQVQLVLDEGLAVVINVGNEKGVEVGTVFEIYRASTYKGRVQVIQLSEDTSLCRIMSTVHGAAIEAGDHAATRL